MIKEKGEKNMDLQSTYVTVLIIMAVCFFAFLILFIKLKDFLARLILSVLLVGTVAANFNLSVDFLFQQTHEKVIKVEKIKYSPRQYVSSTQLYAEDGNIYKTIEISDYFEKKKTYRIEYYLNTNYIKKVEEVKEKEK